MSNIRALVVADGIMSFGPIDPTDFLFTLNFLIGSLRDRSITVDTAHRRVDQHAMFQKFKFAVGQFEEVGTTTVDLANYDEVWLIGYEGRNIGVVDPGFSSIGEAEVAAIATFMDGGGGVFATGDHDGLGSFLSGQVPRVRSMRKWFDDTAPPGYPVNWPPLGKTRADTTRPDHANMWFFDNQSDDIPQPLKIPGGSAQAHPILQGPDGVITKFPDHMHEGEVVVPWTTGDTLVFAGQSFKEYKTAVGESAPELPRVIATGSVIGGHPTPIEGSEGTVFTGDADDTNAKPTLSTLCAYDGHKVNVGRVVTDSSFHHLIDLNLTGDPLGIGGKKKGFTTAAGAPVLDGMRAFFFNTAVWLARESFYYRLVPRLLRLPWWVELFDPGGPVESDPSRILHYGSLLRQELARNVQDAMTVDWVDGKLTPNGIGGAAQRHFAGDIRAAILGGGALELMRAAGRAGPAGLAKLTPAEARTAFIRGTHVGLRALGAVVRKSAEESVALATKLLAVGSDKRAG